MFTCPPCGQDRLCWFPQSPLLGVLCTTRCCPCRRLGCCSRHDEDNICTARRQHYCLGCLLNVPFQGLTPQVPIPRVRVEARESAPHVVLMNVEETASQVFLMNSGNCSFNVESILNRKISFNPLITFLNHLSGISEISSIGRPLESQLSQTTFLPVPHDKGGLLW